MCELTCWSKHLFQSVAKDGIMHSSRATLINICYNTEMPCSPSLQVGLKFCSFFLAAMKVIVYCLACYSASCGMALWEVSWQAHLFVAPAAASKQASVFADPEFLWQLCVVAHWSVGQKGELNAGVSFYKGLSSFLWEVRKLIMINEVGYFLSKCVSQGHSNSVAKCLIGLQCFSVSMHVGCVEELLLLTGLHKQRQCWCCHFLFICPACDK